MRLRADLVCSRSIYRLKVLLCTLVECATVFVFAVIFKTQNKREVESGRQKRKSLYAHIVQYYIYLHFERANPDAVLY